MLNDRYDNPLTTTSQSARDAYIAAKGLRGSHCGTAAFGGRLYRVVKSFMLGIYLVVGSALK